jgi:NitT/TauT family transport system substrate-binding protein
MKRTLAVAIAAAASLILAACSGGSAAPTSSPVAPTSSAAAVPLNFQLSWFPGGDNLAFWAGLDQGFFLEEGIDLTIDSATDPTISQKLIATGEKPIGIAYAGDIVVAKQRRMLPLGFGRSEVTSSLKAAPDDRPARPAPRCV